MNDINLRKYLISEEQQSFHGWDFSYIDGRCETNLLLCKEKLEPLGITVKCVNDDDKLDYPNEHFDLVINRHESFDEAEVYRVLKPGGYFITQQVGGQNDRDLIEMLLGDIPLSFPYHDLIHNVEILQNVGFTVLEQMEEMTEMKIFDLGAVVYFAKQCVWEFPNFSVDRCFEKLKTIGEETII